MIKNVTVPAVRARCLLEQVAPLLCLTTARGVPPQVLADGSGLRCPITERVFPYCNGILDLLGNGLEKTFTQHTLDTSFTAWTYDRFRGRLTRVLSVPDFDLEVARTQKVLQARNGDVILDLACGQGNFTVEWAGRVGREGLVIGRTSLKPCWRAPRITSDAGGWTTCCSSAATPSSCPSPTAFFTR